MHKKEFKLKKGSGFHLDQFLLGFMTFVCALFGLPWMCAATVRSIAHVSALSVMSRTHAPGEKPKLLEVKDQRVTNITMNVLIGRFSKTVLHTFKLLPFEFKRTIFIYTLLSYSVAFFNAQRALLPFEHWKKANSLKYFVLWPIKHWKNKLFLFAYLWV